MEPSLVVAQAMVATCRELITVTSSAVSLLPNQHGIMMSPRRASLSVIRAKIMPT